MKTESKKSIQLVLNEDLSFTKVIKQGRKVKLVLYEQEEENYEKKVKSTKFLKFIDDSYKPQPIKKIERVKSWRLHKSSGFGAFLKLKK